MNARIPVNKKAAAPRRAVRRVTVPPASTTASRPRNARTPLLPRTKKARRQVEYLGGVSMALFGILISLAFFSSGLHQRMLGSPQVAAVVSAVLVNLTNTDRDAQGLGALTINPVLVAAAQAKANDMAAKSYFAHTSPEGVDPWHWFQEAGYTFDYAGENLAVDFSDSGDVNTAWMNSPTHRENLLDPHYTEIGIATAQGMYQGHPTTFVVQEFGTPSSKRVQPAIAQESIPKAPTVIATAKPKEAKKASAQESRVLGSEVHAQQEVTAAPTTRTVSAPTPKSFAAPVHETAITDPALAARLEVAASQSPPAWAFFAGFPRKTLQYAYYLLALLVLVALALETGLELRWHHRQHAVRASILLVSMLTLFIIADAAFFAAPVLALVAY